MKDLKYLQLFDSYGVMLTENQRDVCELYYLCDLSLTEIAEERRVSKQSVSDALAKSRAILEDYENKLHFNEINQSYSLAVKQMIGRAKGALERFKTEHPAFGKEMDEIASYLNLDGEQKETAPVGAD